MNHIAVRNENYSLQERQIGSCFILANGLYLFLILHGLLGIIRFGHPQLANTSLRSIYEISFNLVRIVPVPLVSIQALQTFSKSTPDGSALYRILNHEYLLFFLIFTVILTLLNELYRGYAIIKLVVLLSNIGILFSIGLSSESYWTMFMAVLVIMNNFCLDMLSRRYSISLIEIFLVGLCFFAVFALNSLIDLVELAKEH